MKHNVKHRILTISNKLTMEIRIIVDDSKCEFSSSYEGSKYTTLSINPIIDLSIIKAMESDENGQRVKAPWNPNDHLILTKYTFPILFEELHGIQQDMKKPELYTYHGKRLELNETLAENIRRVFMIGDMTIELSAVVIIQNDETRVEGIKMKFNNEQSSVLLTLNDLTSLIFNMNHLDIDSLTIAMYSHFVKMPAKSIASTTVNLDFPLPAATVDIVPKA